MDPEDLKIRYVPNQELKEKRGERGGKFCFVLFRLTWKALLFKKHCQKDNLKALLTDGSRDDHTN